MSVADVIRNGKQEIEKISHTLTILQERKHQTERDFGEVERQYEQTLEELGQQIKEGKQLLKLKLAQQKQAEETQYEKYKFQLESESSV